MQGFPTLKYIKQSGSATDYSSGRTAADIVAFVVKKSGPATVALDSKEAIDTFAASADAVVVGFFKDAKSKGAALFTEVRRVLQSARLRCEAERAHEQAAVPGLF